jgi:acyl-CoA synthetase (AMP-forming)/AMP-acid ligase II
MLAKYMSAEGKELGPGETGELWLAGPNVFQGYWKNEAATSDALTEEHGMKWFKTGDVGFQDEKHNFYITDRVKVSLGGRRRASQPWNILSRGVDLCHAPLRVVCDG